MKRKNLFLIANVLIMFLIFVVFYGIQTNELSYYREMAFRQAQNDVTLTAIDINSQITNMSTEQRVSAQMMANDIFLKKWCETETEDASSGHTDILYKYLSEYKEKYGYDVVFFVSNKTYNYYYDGGLNKVISPKDDFDLWYFNFLNLNQEYDIQIDHDEVNDFSVSLFVNCLVKDDDGKILGVVGSGRLINGFRDSLADLTNTFDVDIAVVNIGNAHNSFKSSSGSYMTVDDASKSLGLSKDEIVQDVSEDGITWSKDNNCYSLRNNEDLNWNIIVRKDTSTIIQKLLEQTYQRTAFIVGIMIIYMIASFTFLYKLRQISEIKENTDDVTGLINKKLFTEDYEKLSKSFFTKTPSSLFVLDIDDFKLFNDSYGHLYGNTVLHLMADELSATLGKEGKVCRWGGDEFIGVVFHDSVEAYEILNRAQESLKSKDVKHQVTFSCGIADIGSRESLKSVFDRADTALYKAKENGKAQSVVYAQV
ncbi:sensor domain-containing diguanylate cyclase [Oribacterium sp. WCC10]|uniref:sensor domain-containing diguanylate cyclase n=1 Tax=Oribacterium sp. WCC10 TaxID=1855343 RepID=UPI001587C49E|nr:sensor domain-containing diguanylate cyclase [Oribacterium sp. WCC10]